MNSNWQTTKLGSVIKLEYGKPLADEDRDPNGKYPAYGANGVKNRTNKFYYDKPSIIVGRKGSAGEINLTEEKFWPLDVTYFVTFDDSKLDLKFLYNLLSTLCLTSLARGVKPGINRNDIYSLQVHIPSLPEQQRIVAVLDEAFAGIATATENAKKNLQNARELFESHLQSIFTTKGDGWMAKPLKEVCEKITDGTHQTPTYFENGVVFLSSKNVTSGVINWDNVRYIDNKQHLEMHKRVSPRLNDILLAKNGTTGVAAIVDRETVFDIYVSLALLRPLDAILPRFLLHFINSPAAKKQFNKRLKGIGVPNLHLEEIREVTIAFPKSLSEQQQIVSQLDVLSIETKRLEAIYQQKLGNLVALKQSILQKAFAGELTNHISAQILPFPQKIPGVEPSELQAGIIAIAYLQHKKSAEHLPKLRRKKVEKIVHLAEAWAGIDMERRPTQMQYGPADIAAMDAAEAWAADNHCFTFDTREAQHKLEKGKNLEAVANKTKDALGKELCEKLDSLISKTLHMTGMEIEVLATLHAAWNNRLLNNEPIIDEEIILDARDRWHASKTAILRKEFGQMLKWMKQNNIVPEGKGKLVSKGRLL